MEKWERRPWELNKNKDGYVNKFEIDIQIPTQIYILPFEDEI